MMDKHPTSSPICDLRRFTVRVFMGIIGAMRQRPFRNYSRDPVCIRPDRPALI
jgi:hypothetical protein